MSQIPPTTMKKITQWEKYAASLKRVIEFKDLVKEGQYFIFVICHGCLYKKISQRAYFEY